MKTEQPVAIRLADYKPYPFEITHTNLQFDLYEEATIVCSELSLSRKPEMSGPLVLDGEGLELLNIEIDGVKTKPSCYHLTGQSLTIPDLPDRCNLRITTRFSPKNNKALSGLYMSGGRFCTQCEAQGFRHITYYPDRPDVMSKFTVRVEADKAFPTLLSNGNLLEHGDLNDHRHFAVWEDPFKKPAYLFALVAGVFDMIEDHFTTMSAKTVPLRIYVDPGDGPLATYAMDALKRAMKWDEDVFGREYDLDLFMIVAVRSFNFGAMENKGLNIFNSSVLLADAATATDVNFERIESVVAHEYFHNWTGNRITCRDWFQLCLKEGLTVFRDQEFSADQRGRVVSRIKDVKALRARQFPEDAGPLAHPVRPSSYMAIDNFYTATVYEKGAELIRALKTMLGDEMFAKGMAYYFETLDGTASTMEQFIACFAHVSDMDLSNFLTWYGQAGTPVVTIQQDWDADTGQLTLTLHQQTAPTPGQSDKQPVPIPVRTGLLGRNGPLSFTLAEQTSAKVDETILLLENETQSWVFDHVVERPVVSAFRRFSAPVVVKMDHTRAEQSRLISSDPDLFNRWEEAQAFGRGQLLDMTNKLLVSQSAQAEADYLGAISAVLDDIQLEPAFRALVLQPPTLDEIFQEMKNAVPEAILSARNTLIQQIATHNQKKLLDIHTSQRPDGKFSPDAKCAGQRALANQALLTLSTIDEPEIQQIAWAAWNNAENMTDTMAALTALDRTGSTRFQEALDIFYQKWHQNPLVLDKWFSLQAMSAQATPQSIQQLLDHPEFSCTNPNRARSVYGVFATANLPFFHRSDGAGYQALARGILEIDPYNPALAARLTGAFESWRRVEPNRREQAEMVIKTIRDKVGISKNTFEIASRHLG